jgi:hypothetical protein
MCALEESAADLVEERIQGESRHLPFLYDVLGIEYT